MPLSTRRRVLAGTATTLALLAGCAGSESRHDEVHRSDAKPVEYEFVRARSTSEPQLFWTEDREDTTENLQRQRVGREYLATGSDVETVEFVDTADGERLRTFVSETDFDNESVYLYSTAVSECHEIHLQQATVADDGGPHLQFCQSVRPADLACTEDVKHTVVYAVRFPTDGRDVSGTGSGMSHQCEDRPLFSTFDTTVTVQEGDGE